ncbi:MAG: hypothetical protein J5902_03885 [Paludibacteraceae bacterium]|nr:hypothetical protein [Paludibacteraceae bacterium]
MTKNAVTFSQLCARLERAIHYPCGLYGLEVLIHGWVAKYGLISRNTLAVRANRDGERYLTLNEAKLFSTYAGYDLTKD